VSRVASIELHTSGTIDASVGPMAWLCADAPVGSQPARDGVRARLRVSRLIGILEIDGLRIRVRKLEALDGTPLWTSSRYSAPPARGDSAMTEDDVIRFVGSLPGGEVVTAFSYHIP
jgi:hypothetical protein